ncbi:MAG: hypothetical protein PHC51_08850 [bacterium]|nr:hypothetical protein [bacterium]
MNPVIRTSLITSAIFLLAICGLVQSRTLAQKNQTLSLDNKQLVYLPNVDKVKLVTLGFDNFASDIFWFQTLNYFGKEFTSSRDFRWLKTRCDLVTRLDPSKKHAFEFCGSLLSWVAGNPRDGITTLTLASLHHPDEWRFPYLRGFLYWYFLENNQKAQKDMELAAKKPEAPLFLANLASRLGVANSNPQEAISFLESLINQSNDAEARQALTEKLQLAVVARDLIILNQLIGQDSAESGDCTETNFAKMLNKQLIKSIPVDPFGDEYLIDKISCTAYSRSAGKGLEFHGKTAKTGLLRKKFLQNNGKEVH